MKNLNIYTFIIIFSNQKLEESISPEENSKGEPNQVILKQ
jgi:hypothetical protein